MFHDAELDDQQNWMNNHFDDLCSSERSFVNAEPEEGRVQNGEHEALRPKKPIEF